MYDLPMFDNGGGVVLLALVIVLGVVLVRLVRDVRVR